MPKPDGVLLHLVDDLLPHEHVERIVDVLLLLRVLVLSIVMKRWIWINWISTRRQFR